MPNNPDETRVFTITPELDTKKINADLVKLEAKIKATQQKIATGTPNVKKPTISGEIPKRPRIIGAKVAPTIMNAGTLNVKKPTISDGIPKRPRIIENKVAPTIMNAGGGGSGGNTIDKAQGLRERFSGLSKKILKMNRTVALVVGTFLMLNSVIGNVVESFDKLNEKLVEVDKNLRITNASRESFKNPANLDNAIKRISELSGMTKGQAGAQLGTIYSEFKASGQEFDEANMTKIAELAFAYAGTGAKEMSMDKAFEVIQGLVSGRVTAGKAGLLGYKKGANVESSLASIEKLLRARATYDVVMQGNTASAIKTRGDNALTNTFERMYEIAPTQLKNNIVSTTNYKEQIMASTDEKGQTGFIKAFNSIGAILDKISTLTSPSESLNLAVEGIIRTFDILTELWIALEPFLNIIFKIINGVLSIVQPIIPIITRALNLLGTFLGAMSGTVSPTKMMEVWDEYKNFANNRLDANAEGTQKEGQPVIEKVLPFLDNQNKLRQKKVTYKSDMGVEVTTTVNINSKDKLDTDVQVTP